MKIQEHISAKFYIYLYQTFEAKVSDFDSALDSDLGEMVETVTMGGEWRRRLITERYIK